MTGNKITFKRILKLAISLMVFAYSIVSHGMRRLIGKRTPATCVILYYHGIPVEHQDRFARQMDSLLRWAKPISVDSKISLNSSQRYVGLTFDDAFESVLQVALPELKKRQIPATVFAISGCFGRKMGWDGYPERVMTVDQLNQLPSNLITIGSHTITHPSLPLLSELEAKSEISGSRTKLEELLHREIALFSFPFGAFNEKMIGLCHESGYARVFTTLPVLALNDPEEFVTGRVAVEPTDWPVEFFLKLFGAYRWFPWGLSLKRSFFRDRAANLAANPDIRTNKIGEA